MAINHEAIGLLYSEWYDIENKILSSNLHSISIKKLMEPTYIPKEGTTDEVEFEIALKFQDIPCRATQKKSRNIDIYVKSRTLYKIVSRTEKEILDYNTEVQYCKKSEGKLTCIMGYHYDGDSVAKQYGHPIFHMHFKNDVLYNYICEVDKTGAEVINSSTNERDETRIPTAQMDILNTFVSIFADHVFSNEESLENFQTFLNNLNPLLTKCNVIKDKLYGNGPQTESCYSNRWYPISI